jgi:hypothetical protein
MPQRGVDAPPLLVRVAETTAVAGADVRQLITEMRSKDGALAEVPVAAVIPVPPRATEQFIADRYLPPPGGQIVTVVRLGDLRYLSIQHLGSAASACRNLPDRAWEKLASRGADVACERLDASTMVGQWTESGTAWNWSAQALTRSEVQAMLDRVVILR